MADSLTNDAALIRERDEDFDDSTETGGTGLEWDRLDLTVLRHPIVIRSLVGVVIAIAIIVWPDRTDRILARLVGLGLIGLGGTAVYAAVRNRPILRFEAALGAAAVAVGVFLLVAPPDQAGVLLGRGLGLVTIGYAIRRVVRAARDDEMGAWPLAQAGAIAGLGALLVLFPETMLTTAVVLFGAAWIALGLIAVAMSVDPSTPGIASYSDAGRMAGHWLDSRPKDADDRQALYAKILYDGPTASRRITRFFSLMGFAAVIASTGVVGDSTAVVIGAMLIAPLMTPLMGMAISLVMGWPNRLGRSATIAGLGIVFAIAIGFAVGVLSPTPIDTATNSQILARTSPTVLDLLIAIAAGAAGAYGLSRPDVSDSLPGVAIAISLVPPLTVVGISYSQGDFVAGGGALLLFATNMLAILLVGGITFVVTGVTPVRRLTENQHRTRTAIAAAAGLATLVVGALLLNGAQVARDVANQSDADATVAAWIEDHPNHDVIQVVIDDNAVTVVVIGPTEEAPDAQVLATRLAGAFNREMTARVRLVVEEREAATASP